MKFVTSASVVASAVLPLALAAPQSASYSLLAINSGTPIQARPIQAVDGTFNIGRDASVDCGGDASGACQRYKGTAVVFADGGMGLVRSPSLLNPFPPFSPHEPLLTPYPPFPPHEPLLFLAFLLAQGTDATMTPSGHVWHELPAGVRAGERLLRVHCGAQQRGARRGRHCDDV